MTKLDHIDENKILQVIKEGVYEAMWDMLASRPQHDLFDHFKEGVCDAIQQTMPSKQNIIEAISDGIYKSMPWPSEIGQQIYHGTKDAHK